MRKSNYLIYYVIRQWQQGGPSLCGSKNQGLCGVSLVIVIPDFFIFKLLTNGVGIQAAAIDIDGDEESLSRNFDGPQGIVYWQEVEKALSLA